MIRRPGERWFAAIAFVVAAFFVTFWLRPASPQGNLGSGVLVTSFFLQPAASTNATIVKATPGVVSWVLAENNSATVNYVRFYNIATAPTCSSATGLVFQVQIPASTTVGGINVALPYGVPFSNGIGICVTSGYATTDVTNATATAISLTIGYN